MTITDYRDIADLAAMLACLVSLVGVGIWLCKGVKPEGEQ